MTYIVAYSTLEMPQPVFEFIVTIHANNLQFSSQAS